jgi:hypothetical protein
MLVDVTARVAAALWGSARGVIDGSRVTLIDVVCILLYAA